MHELALMESLVATVHEKAAGSRVLAVRLELGALAAVVPAALEHCFALCARGTALEGARLDIIPIEARFGCRRCGLERTGSIQHALCPCGSAEVEVLAGEGMRVREVEVI